MKNFLFVLPVTALMLFGVGCTDQPTKAQPQVDFFQKKQECASYLQKERDFVEKNSGRPLLESSICYSTKYNSCVFLYTLMNPNGSYTILTEDALTGAVIPRPVSERGVTVTTNIAMAMIEMDNAATNVQCAK